MWSDSSNGAVLSSLPVLQETCHKLQCLGGVWIQNSECSQILQAKHTVVLDGILAWFSLRLRFTLPQQIAEGHYKASAQSLEIP